MYDLTGFKLPLCNLHIVLDQIVKIVLIMNHDCTTHPMLPFITITTKFLSKHCIKRVLDTEMNGYHRTLFYRKKLFLGSVDPKQPKNVKFSL
jgi:hypothetical protein